MTEKRFEVVLNEFDEVEYIMDKEMMEDRDFAEFIDFVEDVCKENEQLKTQLQNTCDQRDEFHRGARENANRVGQLEKENQQLRQILDIGETNAKDIVDVLNIQQREIRELEKQREELFIRERNTKNKLRELQERNNRQCQQLDTLYKLIEKQDWKTLTGLIQEFQECEEQLQKEWGSYGDEWMIKEKDEHLAWKRVDLE